MKKFLGMLLTTIMCVSIVACGSSTDIKENQDFLSQTQTNTETQNENTELTANADAEIFDNDYYLQKNSALVLQVVINPEFVIFIDTSGQICSVRCLNEDAETLFANLDVKGKGMETGMNAILEAACEQGFLNEDTEKIQIISSVHNGLDWTPELNTAITELVTDFTNQKKLDTVVSVVEPEITDTTGSYETTTEYKRTQEWEDEEGDRGILYYDENGNRVKSVIYYANGDYVEIEFYVGTNLNKTELTIRADGSSEEYHFADDGYETEDEIHLGTNIYQKEVSPNGDYMESSYDEVTHIWNTRSYRGGIYRESASNLKGNIVKYIYRNDNIGEYEEMLYYANGNMQRYEYRNDSTGESCIKTYDENGNLLEQTQ